MALDGKWFGVAIALLVLPNAVQAQETPATIHATAHETAIAAGRAAISEAMQADSIPAMAVAVYHGDTLIWSEAFGVADVENDIAATPAHMFRIGSVAKLFTATLAARLAQEGLIDLDRPIGEYLEQWPDRHPPITLRQLLGHLGGIRHYIGRDRDFSQPGGMIDLRFYPDQDAVLAIFAEDDLVAAPGQAFNYSTFGYSLVGAVLEAATGSDYYSLLQTHVLEPGAIENVRVDDMFAIVPNRARVYDAVEDYQPFLPDLTGSVVNALPLNSAYKLAAGGLVADAASVARFGTLHFAPGLLTEDMFVEMFTSQQTNAGEVTGTGLGWRIGTDAEGRTFYHHSGSQQGSRAHLAVYPAQNISVALVSNLGSRPREILDLSTRISEPFLN